MTINPGAVILLVVGAAAVLIGIRGTQSATFAAITGHSSGSASSSSGNSGATPVQPATLTSGAAMHSTASYLTNAQV